MPRKRFAYRRGPVIAREYPPIWPDTGWGEFDSSLVVYVWAWLVTIRTGVGLGGRGRVLVRARRWGVITFSRGVLVGFLRA
jgi:hypothetical protein